MILLLIVSNITGYSLMSGAGFIIALGVIIIILSVIGHYKEIFYLVNFNIFILIRFYWSI